MLINHVGFFFELWKLQSLILIEVLICLQMQHWIGQRDKVIIGLWFDCLLFAFLVTNETSGVLAFVFAFVCMLKMMVYGCLLFAFVVTNETNGVLAFAFAFVCMLKMFCLVFTGFLESMVDESVGHLTVGWSKRWFWHSVSRWMDRRCYIWAMHELASTQISWNSCCWSCVGWLSMRQISSTWLA